MSEFIRISSRQNAYLRHAVKLAGSRAYRFGRREFTAAGDKLLSEALRCGLKINTLITTDENADTSAAERTLLISEDLMSAVSPLDDAQSTLFCAAMPDLGGMDSVLSDGFSILLDCVQDPGNVGAILRSADAFGAHGVLLLPGCADIWNPKALRASMGAAFRLPAAAVTLETLTPALNKSNLPLIGTALSRNAKNILDPSLPLGRCLLAMGNEGHGLSEDVLGLCREIFRIPMTGRTESLNVAQAAAVILWEAQNS